MPINVTSKDARSSILMTPGWYILYVREMIPEPAKDGSQNWIYNFDVISDDKGGKEFEGCRVFPLYLNEKGIFGSGLNFLVACGFPKEQMEKLKKKELQNVSIDEKSPVGKTIRAMITTNEYQGKKSNQATDFLEYKAPVA